MYKCGKIESNAHPTYKYRISIFRFMLQFEYIFEDRIFTDIFSSGFILILTMHV